MGVAAAACCFIDDNLVNVVGAKRAGMWGVWVVGVGNKGPVVESQARAAGVDFVIESLIEIADWAPLRAMDGDEGKEGKEGGLMQCGEVVVAGDYNGRAVDGAMVRARCFLHSLNERHRQRHFSTILTPF